MLFPVLHYPDCFGSEPNPLLCIKAVCEHGGIRCAEALIKHHKQATKGGLNKPSGNGQNKPTGGGKSKAGEGKVSAGSTSAEPTVISLDWLNARRNIKVKLSLEYVLP
jgi:hypothetical protein